ncbi:MAG: hypothetical protein AB1483_13330 [Candidatus Zixiibacteriota bacterium]
MTLVACNARDVRHDEVGSVRISYVENWYMTTTLPLSCQRLKDEWHPYKDTTLKETAELERWTKTIGGLKKVKLGGDFAGDCRVCCEIVSSDGKLLHQIAVWPAGMTVDDTVYFLDSALISLVAHYLPRGYFTHQMGNGDWGSE